MSVNITTKASTNNFTISWLEPYILPGYSIYQYNITISDQNTSLYNEYTSIDTEFEIESEEVNNASCIEIYGVYCGGEGESLFAPLLADGKIIEKRMVWYMLYRALYGIWVLIKYCLI